MLKTGYPVPKGSPECPIYQNLNIAIQNHPMGFKGNYAIIPNKKRRRDNLELVECGFKEVGKDKKFEFSLKKKLDLRLTGKNNGVEEFNPEYIVKTCPSKSTRNTH